MMELVYDVVEISKDKSCINISLRSICLNFAQQVIA
jgi:hypothetical protein